MRSNYREEFINKLVWRKPISAKTNSNRDITVNIGRLGDIQKARTNITFRNGVDQLISNTGYVTLSIYKNRIVFMEASPADGYKMGEHGTKSSKYTQIAFSQGDDEFEGDYDLKYDDFLELYYIEKEANK